MSNPRGYDILAVGSPFVDRLIRVSEEFVERLEGEKGGAHRVDIETLLAILDANDTEEVLVPGGSASNTIKGLANLGHKCGLLGKMGNDDLGKRFAEGLKGLPIVPMLSTGSLPTGQVACLITPDGERTQRPYPGAGTEMKLEEILSGYFDSIQHLVLEGYSFRIDHITERSAELGKEAGATVSLNLSAFEIIRQYRQPIEYILTNFVDVLFCNEVEAKELTGKEAEEACRELSRLCGVACVTMSERGCWVGQDGSATRCPTTPIQPVDSTGAGDLFCSGFLHGYLNGKPLETCAAYGAAVASAVIQVMGPEVPPDRWPELIKQLS